MLEWVACSPIHPACKKSTFVPLWVDGVQDALIFGDELMINRLGLALRPDENFRFIRGHGEEEGQHDAAALAR